MSINISRIANVICRNQYHGNAAFSCFQIHIKLIALLVVIAIVLIAGKAIATGDDSTGISATNIRTNSILPIVMYDSDIGFGFGVKSVFKNYCRHKESFDLLLFGSTKGEQNYVLCFNIPDSEIRHGTKYPVAVDVELEFDKLLKSNYFGIGNNPENNDFQFPRELTDIDLGLSHALNSQFIIGIGLRYAHYAAYGYDPNWGTITHITPGAGESDLTTASAFGRYDTRDSYINPTGGLKAELTFERAMPFLNNDWNFSKARFEFSEYLQMFYKKHILAYRLWFQQATGDAPYQELSKIGDGWTARGYKAGRFIDKSMALISAEYRFPLYKKLGGVAFFDTGRVWPGLDKFNFKNWHSDIGVGLRLYLENFVARLDIGHSSESTRIFFNFGQVF